MVSDEKKIDISFNGAAVRDKLLSLMREFDLSERALAAELGVSHGTVNRTISMGAPSRKLEEILFDKYGWTLEGASVGDAMADLVTVLGREAANRVRSEFLDPQALAIAQACGDIMTETGRDVDSTWEAVRDALKERPTLVDTPSRLALAAMQREPSKATQRRERRRQGRDEEASGTRPTERGRRAKKAK